LGYLLNFIDISDLWLTTDWRPWNVR